VNRIADLKIKIFADGADLDGIAALAGNPLIAGFTTNPSLMRKAGVRDYETFAREVLCIASGRPVSFEVFADDFAGMIEQARTIASWGSNAVVKIPVTNTKGEFTGEVLRALSADGISLNVTAVFTHVQVQAIADVLEPEAQAIISVFAGRIADTGIDPVSFMEMARWSLRCRTKVQLLWASTRELFNIFQAERCGCDIITVTPDILAKLNLVGKDLAEYSRETVQEFHRNATAEFEVNVAPLAAE
jgi:transaldolase